MSVRDSKIYTGPRAATGHRIGEGHHRAKHSEELVRLIREEHEPGVRGSGYLALAKRHGIPESTVRDFLIYRTRWRA